MTIKVWIGNLNSSEEAAALRVLCDSFEGSTVVFPVRRLPGQPFLVRVEADACKPVILALRSALPRCGFVLDERGRRIGVGTELALEDGDYLASLTPHNLATYLSTVGAIDSL